MLSQALQGVGKMLVKGEDGKIYVVPQPPPQDMAETMGRSVANILQPQGQPSSFGQVTGQDFNNHRITPPLPILDTDSPALGVTKTPGVVDSASLFGTPTNFGTQTKAPYDPGLTPPQPDPMFNSLSRVQDAPPSAHDEQPPKFEPSKRVTEMLKRADDLAAKSANEKEPSRNDYGAKLNLLQTLGLALPAILTGRSGYIGKGVQGYMQGQQQAYQEALLKKQQRQAQYATQAKELTAEANRIQQMEWDQHKEATGNYWKNREETANKGKAQSALLKDGREEGTKVLQKFIDRVSTNPNGANENDLNEYQGIVNQFEGEGKPFRPGELSKIIPMLRDGEVGAKGIAIRNSIKRLETYINHTASKDALATIMAIGSGNLTEANKKLAYENLKVMDSGAYTALTPEDIAYLSKELSLTEEGKNAMAALGITRRADIIATRQSRINVMKANAEHLKNVTSLLDSKDQREWFAANTQRGNAMSQITSRDAATRRGAFEAITKQTTAQRLLIDANLGAVRARYKGADGYFDISKMSIVDGDSDAVKQQKTADNQKYADLVKARESLQNDLDQATDSFRESNKQVQNKVADTTPPLESVKDAVNVANKNLGKVCKPGTPSCAGWASIALRQTGVNTPIHLGAKALIDQVMLKGGRKVPLNEAQPGDLVYDFGPNRGSPDNRNYWENGVKGGYHVMVYAGNGQVYGSNDGNPGKIKKVESNFVFIRPDRSSVPTQTAPAGTESDEALLKRLNAEIATYPKDKSKWSSIQNSTIGYRDSVINAIEYKKKKTPGKKTPPPVASTGRKFSS